MFCECAELEHSRTKNSYVDLRIHTFLVLLTFSQVPLTSTFDFRRSQKNIQEPASGILHLVHII